MYELLEQSIIYSKNTNIGFVWQKVHDSITTRSSKKSAIDKSGIVKEPKGSQHSQAKSRCRRLRPFPCAGMPSDFIQQGASREPARAVGGFQPGSDSRRCILRSAIKKKSWTPRRLRRLRRCLGECPPGMLLGSASQAPAISLSPSTDLGARMAQLSTSMFTWASSVRPGINKQHPLHSGRRSQLFLSGLRAYHHRMNHHYASRFECRTLNSRVGKPAYFVLEMRSWPF